MMEQIIVIPKWFKIVAGVALVWNLLGLMAFVMQVTMSVEQLNALNDVERNFYTHIPWWATAAFACAVIFGVLGCILLLIKKRMAMPVFMVSFAGLIVQLSHAYLISDFTIISPPQLMMSVLLLLIASALLYLAHYATKREWLT